MMNSLPPKSSVALAAMLTVPPPALIRAAVTVRSLSSAPFAFETSALPLTLETATVVVKMKLPEAPAFGFRMPPNDRSSSDISGLCHHSCERYLKHIVANCN